MSDRELLEAGTKLRHYFAEKARERSVTITPTVRDDRTTVLCGRLYEEASGDRLFHMVESRDIRGLDSFTKMTGLNFELELLCVLTPLDDTHFPALWDAYFQWIHERADSQTIFGKLNSETE